MANVGSGSTGQTLVGAGNGASPTYVPIGTNSGLTAHGVLISEGSGAFQATSTGTSGQVLQSGGSSNDPDWSTATYPSTAGTSGNVLTSDGTNWISSPNSGGNTLIVTGTLTSSQIKNLVASPVIAVPAPASGNIIQVIDAIAKLNYGGSNVFVAAVGQDIALSYSGVTNPGSIGQLLSNTSITSSSDKIGLNAGFSSGSFDYSLLNGAPIYIINESSTEISGNASNDNTISYSITYQVVTI